MRHRERLENTVRVSFRTLPQVTQLMDANLRLRGFERLLSIWPTQTDEAAVTRAADVFELHSWRNYPTEQAAGRLLVAGCSLEPLAPDYLPTPQPTCGVALWLEPDQLENGILDLSDRLDAAAMEAMVQRGMLRLPDGAYILGPDNAVVE